MSSLIDWTEIPKAHVPRKGQQDRFELFARDFLETIGFEILQGPGRGADRGRDLLVAEHLSGTISNKQKLWLVSCKHKAHSGKSVTDRDELDPIGRVRKFKADGFIGFYSTLPSSGFDDTISRITCDIEVFIWDKGRIETALVTDPRLFPILRNYFPKSYAKFRVQGEKTAIIFSEPATLECENCGKDILQKDGLVLFVKEKNDRSHIYSVNNKTSQIKNIYWSCIDACYEAVKDLVKEGGQEISTVPLGDLRIPTIFIWHLSKVLFKLHATPNSYSDKALEKQQYLFIVMAQTVMREVTDEQLQRINYLASMPLFLGGLGFVG